jgi:hypothetical protein
MKMYNHAYSIAFSVVSKHPEGDDITPQQFRHAILKSLAALVDDELMEALGAPFDTYEE